MVYTKRMRFCGCCFKEFYVDERGTPVISNKMVYFTAFNWICNKCLRKILKKHKLSITEKEFEYLLCDIMRLVAARQTMRKSMTLRAKCVKKIIDSGRKVIG